MIITIIFLICLYTYILFNLSIIIIDFLKPKIKKEYKYKDSASIISFKDDSIEDIQTNINKSLHL